MAAAMAVPTESSVAAPHEPFGAIVSTVVGAVSNSGWARAEQGAQIASARRHATLRRCLFIASAPCRFATVHADENAVGPWASHMRHAGRRGESWHCVRGTQKRITNGCSTG